MKLSLSHEQTAQLDKDLVELKTAEACLVDSLNDACIQLSEVSDVMDNMVFAINKLKSSDDPEAVIGLLGLEESCEGLVTKIDGKLTVSAATEGIKEGLVKAWKTFVEWVKKIWNWIKEFLLELFRISAKMESNVFRTA